MLTSLPPDFLFFSQAAVTERHGFGAGYIVNQVALTDDDQHGLFPHIMFDSGDVEMIAELPGENEAIASINVQTNAAEGSAEFNIHQKFVAGVSLEPGTAPFYYLRFGTTTHHFILLRGPKVEDINPGERPEIPFRISFESSDNSPPNDAYFHNNFGLSVRGITWPFDLRRDDQEYESATAVVRAGSTYDMEVDGYLYIMTAMVTSTITKADGWNSTAVPPSGHEWSLDVDRSLNLTVTRLDREGTPPSIKDVTISRNLDAFAGVAPTTTDGATPVNHVTTTLPATMKAIVDPGTKLRYEIQGIIWVVWYTEARLSEELTDYVRTTSLADATHNEDGSISFQHITTPGPGLHGKGTKLFATLVYKDTLTGKIETTEERIEFDLYFNKMGTDEAFYGPVSFVKNWYLYWAQDKDAATSHGGHGQVIDGIEYQYGGPSQGLYGTMMPNRPPVITIYDHAALAVIDEERMRLDFGDPSISNALRHLLPEVAAPIQGIDVVEMALAHERAHAWLVETYGKKWRPLPFFGPCYRGVFAFRDSDCDGLPDVLEEELSQKEVNGQQLQFDPNSPKSYFHTVSGGNDEEAFVILVQFGLLDLKNLKDLLKEAKPEQDFANPGKQTQPSFYRESNETGTSAWLVDVIGDRRTVDLPETLADGIAVDVQVHVHQAGTYTVTSTWVDQNGVRYNTSNLLELERGSQTAEIVIDADQLRSNKIDGDLGLQEMFLFGDGMMEYLAHPDYATADYHFSQFAPRGSAIVTSVSNGDLVTDDDGATRVAFEVGIDGFQQAEDLYLEGYLFTPEGTFVGHAGSALMVQAGHNTATISFDTVNLKRNHIEGPLEVRGVFLWENGEKIDEFWQRKDTPAFTMADWGMPAATFEREIASQPVDLSGDGIADHLEMETSIIVDSGGTYFLKGQVVSSRGEFVGTIDVELGLSPGTHPLSIELDAEPIIVDSLEGPFRFWNLSLYDEDGRLVDLIHDQAAVEYLSWGNFVGDTTKPVSGLEAGSPTSFSNQIQLEVSGEDLAGDVGEVASGIRKYDIFVARDDGEFELWKSFDRAGDVTFEATYGHTYQFFVVATDYAGNTEEKLLTAEVQVEVISPWHNPDNHLDVNMDGIVDVEDVKALVELFRVRGQGDLQPGDADGWYPDISGNGNITSRELSILVNTVLQDLHPGMSVEGESLASQPRVTNDYQMLNDGLGNYSQTIAEVSNQLDAINKGTELPGEMIRNSRSPQFLDEFSLGQSPIDGSLEYMEQIDLMMAASVSDRKSQIELDSEKSEDADDALSLELEWVF